MGAEYRGNRIWSDLFADQGGVCESARELLIKDLRSAREFWYDTVFSATLNFTILIRS